MSLVAASPGIGGRRFPLRHPHLALVIGLAVTAPETEREHEIRFVLLDPDGGEWLERPAASARSQRDGRDATLTFSIDLWNLTFPVAGRLLVPPAGQRLRAQTPAAPARPAVGGLRARWCHRHTPGCPTGPGPSPRHATSIRSSTTSAGVRAPRRPTAGRRLERGNAWPTSTRCPIGCATTTCGGFAPRCVPGSLRPQGFDPRCAAVGPGPSRSSSPSIAVARDQPTR